MLTRFRVSVSMTDCKTILVHLPDPRRAKPVLEATMEIARREQAYVIGLFVVPPAFELGIGMPGTPDPMVMDSVRHDFERNASLIEALFDSALGSSGCSGEWSTVDADGTFVSEVVLTAARSADLVIASQANPAWKHSELTEVPEVLAMESGRPVLLLPNDRAVPSIGKRVLIGWNGGREAARAAFDALPLLDRTEAVRIACASAEARRKDDRAPSSAGLATALSRHGLRCESSTIDCHADNVGAALLAESSTFGADLLVMGCYGHSRLHEVFLGGATRHVLAHMELPVLLTH